MITGVDVTKREMLLECISTMTAEAAKLAEAGKKAEEVQAISRLTIRALLEGTKRFTPEEIELVASSIRIVNRSNV